MLPEVSPQLCYPQQFAEFLVFLLQFFVVNVLFHLGKVSYGNSNFRVSGNGLILTNPVGDGSISLDAINLGSLVSVEFPAQYFINNLLFKPFSVEQLLCPTSTNALFFAHF